MNCPAARRLLEQGVRPSSSPPERAALGFHLAGCADCRAYRTQMDSELLSRLLAADQTMPQPSATPPIEPATKRISAAQAWRVSLSHALWYGSIGLLAAFVLAVVMVVVGAALSIFNIHQNVQAMIVFMEIPKSDFIRIRPSGGRAAERSLPAWPGAHQDYRSV